MQGNPTEKNNLVKFRLKMTNDEHQMLRVMSATDQKYQYEVLFDALCWARKHSEKILPLAYPVNGTFRSCYLESENSDLSDLEASWSCKTNCALYTALALYLRNRKATAIGSFNVLPTVSAEAMS